MLSPADDLPIHQVPEPVRFVATSDRNFFDRYYFNMNDRTNRTILNFGLGVYPNLGVMDCFASVRQGNRQLVVRGSKALGSNRLDMSIGPFRLEVIEGLKKLRWVLEPNEFGLEMDLTFEGLTPPHAEMPRLRRDSNGRISNHGCRYNQVGAWRGRFKFDGEEVSVDPTIWNGVRDRSWGIRPIGEPEPERARLVDYPGLGDSEKASDEARAAENHFWLWVPMLFDDEAWTVIIEERGGRRTMQDAARVPLGADKWIDLGTPEHDLEFISGTRLLKRARLHIPDLDGRRITIEAEPLQSFYTVLGSGYGQTDNFRHGKYMGPLFIDSVRYDFSDPKTVVGVPALIDASARFRLGDKIGYGELSYGVFGAYPRYGFKGPKDVAV